ncbi:MAG TPA: RNA polymerase sigma factor [Kofleriaceae bacterium]|nr:RNA polymerase sigma factor [Kofleriaceae bacterium]
MGQLVPLRRVDGAVHELSDAALLAAAGLGDQAALGALFDRFHADVYRFVARVAAATPSDVDDLVQTTFLEVYRSAARFDGRSAVKTWIFGVAVNVARTHARGERRMQAAVGRYADVPIAEPEPLDTAAARREVLERVARAIDELPYDLRAAYVLCVIEELTARDAAAALDTREGTVWRRVHEARQVIRAALDRRPS